MIQRCADAPRNPKRLPERFSREAAELSILSNVGKRLA
jgi:hypothetical protein